MFQGCDFAPWKEIQDSLGFWIPLRRFRIPGTGFCILCQLNLDSGFQSLVGFRIPSAVFRIPKPRTSNSTTKNFPDSRIRIPYFHGGDHGIEKLQQLKLLRWSFESQIDNLDFHAPCRPIKVNFNLYNFGINDKWKWNEVTKVDLDVLD